MLVGFIHVNILIYMENLSQLALYCLRLVMRTSWTFFPPRIMRILRYYTHNCQAFQGITRKIGRGYPETIMRVIR